MTVPVSWFIQILNMSLGAAWAALLVMLGRCFLRRAPKVFSYALWSVVLFRLVCPVSFTSILSLMPRPQTIPQDIIYAAQPEVESGFVFFDQAVNNSLPPATPAASVNPVQLWLELGNLVWQAGILLLLAYCVVSYLRFWGRLRGAVLLEGRVWESDRIPTAFVLGLFRPRVYLPLGLGEEERRYILCHEETHIRRLDHIIKPLALVLVVIHWFNPVLWVAYFLMCRDMEMSCDEMAMEKLGQDVRKQYSACLLELSARQNGLVIPLAFGENDVKSRIKNVLRYKKPALWVMAAALALAAILAFCLAANPDHDNWIPLSRQKGIPYHDAIWGEAIQVERRNAGTVVLEDAEQVKRLGELVSGLEVGKKPMAAGDQAEDWELRLTFRRSDTADVGDFSLCFTFDRVWGETDGNTTQRYPLKESMYLFQVVEEYTFLTEPSQVGEYPVGFLEVRDGKEGQYVTVTEPLVGSQLASLLLDGDLLEDKPGETPPTDSYLFISMGNPGTTYYVYESGGRYYMERPEDYRLELTQEVYQEIMSIWQTVSRREAPDEENGYYTGFQEFQGGTALRKFSSYRGETPAKLAELILSGEETPLIVWDDVHPMPDSLRVEIRSPYYLFQYDGRYFVEKPGEYALELTADAYYQIRNIYLDAAMEGLENESLSFYAAGEMEDIARVGIEGYYNTFTSDDIPEELRLLDFTVGEITPMAGTLEEFCVSFSWDYDTTEASRWISANGNGAPGEDFAGWHWTDNYQEFRFKRLQGKLYTIVGRGTGGGAQGLAPLESSGSGIDPVWAAGTALTQLFSSTVQQAEEFDTVLTMSAQGNRSDGVGIYPYEATLEDYLAQRYGGSMTQDCIETLAADRTLYRSANLSKTFDADIQVRGLELGERPGDEKFYYYSAKLVTPDGRDAAAAKGFVQLEPDGEVWRASHIAVTLTEQTPAAPTREEAAAATQAERAYRSDDLPRFAMAFQQLDSAARWTWLDKIYKDDEVAFFNVAVQSMTADNPHLDAFAERAYGDGNTTFFSVLVGRMDEKDREWWQARAEEDQNISYQSVLLRSQDKEEELDKLEEELAQKQLEEYAAHGITKDGKNYYYQGQLVNIFQDRRANSSFYTLEINPEGTVNIKVSRNENGEIESVSYMTEAETRDILEDMGE